LWPRKWHFGYIAGPGKKRLVIRSPSGRFLFRLALALGESDPRKLAASMPASLFNMWRMYEQIEPFGAIRDNFHAATLAAMTANINRKKDRDPFTVEDFMYRDRLDQEETDQQKAYARSKQFMAQLKSAKLNMQKKKGS